MWKGRFVLLFSAVLVLALSLRFIPTFVFDEPFSTDVWPLIRISDKLLANPEVKIWDDRFFDGYNNRWPGVVLAASTVSAVLDVDAGFVFKHILLLFTTLSYGLFAYLVFRVLGAGFRGSIGGLLFLLTYPSLLVFSSTTLKEVYAYPFLYALIFSAFSLGFDFKWLISVAVFSLALSLTHPLASFFLLGLCVSFLAVNFTFRVSGRAASSNVSKWAVLLFTHGFVFGTYLLLYGSAGFRVPMFPYDLINYLAYGFFVFGTYLLYLRVGGSFLARAFVFLSPLALILLSTRLPLVSGLNALPLYVLVYALPFIFSLALLIRGFGGGVLYFTAVSAGLFILVNALYVPLAKSELFNIYHRLLNYTAFLGALFVAGFLRLSGRKLIGWVVPLATVFFGVLAIVGVVCGFDSLTYYWGYRRSEVLGFNSLFSLLDCGSVVGDAKVSYFASMVRSVDSYFPLRIAHGLGGSCSECCLVLYEDDFSRGYVVGLSVYSSGFIRDVVGFMSRVYDNSHVYCFRG